MGKRANTKEVTPNIIKALIISFLQFVVAEEPYICDDILHAGYNVNDTLSKLKYSIKDGEGLRAGKVQYANTAISSMVISCMRPKYNLAKRPAPLYYTIVKILMGGRPVIIVLSVWLELNNAAIKCYSTNKNKKFGIDDPNMRCGFTARSSHMTNKVRIENYPIESSLTDVYEIPSASKSRVNLTRVYRTVSYYSDLFKDDDYYYLTPSELHIWARSLIEVVVNQGYTFMHMDGRLRSGDFTTQKTCASGLLMLPRYWTDAAGEFTLYCMMEHSDISVLTNIGTLDGRSYSCRQKQIIIIGHKGADVAVLYNATGGAIIGAAQIPIYVNANDVNWHKLVVMCLIGSRQEGICNKIIWLNDVTFDDITTFAEPSKSSSADETKEIETFSYGRKSLIHNDEEECLVPDSYNISLYKTIVQRMRATAVESLSGNVIFKAKELVDKSEQANDSVSTVVIMTMIVSAVSEALGVSGESMTGAIFEMAIAITSITLSAVSVLGYIRTATKVDTNAFEEYAKLPEMLNNEKLAYYSSVQIVTERDLRGLTSKVVIPIACAVITAIIATRVVRRLTINKISEVVHTVKTKIFGIVQILEIILRRRAYLQDGYTSDMSMAVLSAA